MKNKGLILGLYILAAMLIAGCGNQSQKTEDKPDAGENTEEISEEPDTSQEPQTASGTIRSFTGSYLSIRDEKGDLVSFDLGDAELACKNGIVAGEQVSLVYVNRQDELTGEDIPELLKVTDRKDAEPLAEETFRGTVLDASCNTLTVQGTSENGKDIITFFTVGTEFRCEHGIGPDNEVEVVYRGELQGNSARNVKALSVTDQNTGDSAAAVSPEAETADQADAAVETVEPTAGAQEEPAADAKPEKISASIVRVDGTLLVAEPKEKPGEELEFDMSGAEISLKYGLLQGSEVLLTAQAGGEEDNTAVQDTAAPLISVTDVDPDVVNAETGGFSVTGTVMATGKSTLTVTSDDGAQITCTTEDAKLGQDMEDFPREGAYVVVVIVPDGNSNVYRALIIERAY